MRFAFNPSGSLAGGLRLIDEIPDFAICHLEGRNGVGKSLALRLLEMASGEQPYQSTPAAWSSLRSNLGDTTVTVQSIDGQTLRLDLQPDRWPAEPEPIGEWLGDAVLGDETISVSSIASRLRVIRIAGDETFERTIKRRLLADASKINRAHKRFESQLLELETLFEQLEGAMRSVDTDRSRQQELASAQADIPAADRALRDSQENLAILDAALIAQQRLKAREDELPPVVDQLSEVEKAVKALQKKLAATRKRQAEALAEMAVGSAVKEEISKVRTQRDGRLRRSLQRARKVQSLATQLKISPEIDVVLNAAREVNAERTRIQSELSSAGHNASVRALILRLAQGLGLSRELDNEVIAVIKSAEDTAVRLTVSQLRVGVQERQVELTAIQDDPLLLELRKTYNAVSQRSVALSELRDAIGAHDRARILLSESEDQLAALVSKASATNQLFEKYEAMNSQLVAIEQALYEKLAKEARLRVQADQLRGTQSAEELAEQIQLAIESLHIDEQSKLADYRKTLATTVDQHRTQLHTLRGRELELQEYFAVERAHIAEATKLLAAFTWLPASIRLALARSGEQGSGAAIEALRTAIASVHESLYQVRNRFDHLKSAAEHLAEGVGKHGKTTSSAALLEELATEMGERLRREFDQVEIRTALFDDGQLEAINLRTLEARWVTVEGTQRSRPFEAFSSGEQAFAYTLARIERVTAIDVQHKVIALDEFGAFLARDRLERLVRFLRDAVVGKIADQVIIVVPLAADYQEQAEMTTGDLHERFVRRAGEINRHLYFTEDASHRELI